MVQAQIMKSTPSFGTALDFLVLQSNHQSYPVCTASTRKRSFQPSVENGYFQLPRSFCNIIIVSPCFNYPQRLLKNTITTTFFSSSYIFDPWFNPLPGGSKPPHRWRGVLALSDNSRKSTESWSAPQGVGWICGHFGKTSSFPKPPACCLFCSATSN